MVEVFQVVNHRGLKVHRFQFKIQLEPIPLIEVKSKGSLSPSVQSSLVCRSFLLRLKSPVMVSALSLEPCYIWGRPTEVQIAAWTTALSLSYESLCWPHESFHTVSLKNNHSHEFHHLTVNDVGSAGTSGDNIPNFQSPICSAQGRYTSQQILNYSTSFLQLRLFQGRSGRFCHFLPPTSRCGCARLL